MKLFNYYAGKLKVGEVVSIGVAHRYQDQEWDVHGYDDYEVLSIDQKQIECRMVKYNQTHLTINAKDLNRNFIRFNDNIL